MRAWGALGILALASQALSADQPPSPRQPVPSEGYTATTTAILVDVVVRDKAGRPVTGLTADDFEIYEDRVPQSIGSFAVVERADGININVRRRLPGTTTVATVGAPGTGPAEVEDPPPTTAVLFDALMPESLELAQKAALGYVPMSGGVDGRLGVFTAEPGLRVLQPYTTDAALVRRAIRRVTARGSARKELEDQRRYALADRINQLDALSGAAGSGIGGAFTPGSSNNSTQAQSIVEMQIAQMEMRLLSTFESLDRDHRGTGVTTALLAVVQSLGGIPGRKSIVYFSEGLPASPVVQARLDSIVSAANRSNVSVYTIDASGLRTESTLLETRRELDMAAQERLRQNSVSSDPTNGPLMRIVEGAEDRLRLDPHGGLARLASDTGGFLIRDTNDLGSAFRRIDEDNRFHYLLTYSPTNGEFDGKFRTIEVKVKRPGMQVFSRKGYLALRSPTAPVSSYEAPALAVLDRGEPALAFPISASGFVFPSLSGAAVVPIVVHVGTADLQYQVDDEKGTFSAQATVLARIKDAGGQTHRVVSQQYILTGTAEELAGAKKGEILFYRQPELAPGRYTLETVVYDAVAEKAAARTSALTVPEPGGLTASSLVLVRRTEAVESNGQEDDLPFYYGGMLLYPNTGQPLRRGVDRELTFYFSFYSEGAPPAAIVELWAGGRTIATLPLELPEPTATGRRQHVGRLPVDRFPAGEYQLRVRLWNGKQEESLTAPFRIED